MRYVALIPALVLFTGCASGPFDLALPSHPQPQSLGEALANLKADVPIDLDAAQVIAVAHGDALAAACFPALKQFLVAQTGTATPTPDQIKGVFSAYEKARVERIALEGAAATGVKLPDYLKLGCAALLQDERLFALRIAALIGGTYVGVPGVGGLLPK